MPLLDLVDTTGFRVSFVAGIGGALLIAIIAVSRRPPIIVPVAAAASVVAAVVAIKWTDAASPGGDRGALLTGLVGLGAAGFMMRLAGTKRILGLVAAIPGALLIAQATSRLDE